MGTHNSGDFSVGIGAGTVATADGIAAPSTNDFEHWASVREGSSVKIFRNGLEVPISWSRSIDGPIHPVSESLPFTLGRLGPSYEEKVQWTSGVLDDVAIWNGALTVGQIAEVMRNGVASESFPVRPRRHPERPGDE
jgi:hypothetical protein